ncbi:MAG: 30S ribosomal protein S20 [Alphaproteobacteria bacterium]|nr:30S ribosomal protein S20 [Alphaproteobacteria bacterium]
MAMHKSAKVRIRRNERRKILNKNRISATRTSIRKVEEAIVAGDYQIATAALKAAQPAIHRSADKGLVHKKNASRKLSRLSARIKAIKEKISDS